MIHDIIVESQAAAGHSIEGASQGDSTAMDLEKKIEEGKEIITKAGKLKYEMARDRPLE